MKEGVSKKMNERTTELIENNFFHQQTRQLTFRVCGCICNLLESVQKGTENNDRVPGKQKIKINN